MWTYNICRKLRFLAWDILINGNFFKIIWKPSIVILRIWIMRSSFKWKKTLGKSLLQSNDFLSNLVVVVYWFVFAAVTGDYKCSCLKHSRSILSCSSGGQKSKVGQDVGWAEFLPGSTERTHIFAPSLLGLLSILHLQPSSPFRAITLTHTCVSLRLCKDP